MRLDALVAGASGARVVGDSAVEVGSLAYDSRKVGAGTLFFCVPGEKIDGHEFAAGAVEAGAVALVVERELELPVAQVVVADARAAMAPFAARFWGDPTAELRVVGITGTNGKTTTAFLIREVLEAAGVRCGLLGTVRQVVGGAEEEVERTTPEAIDLQATFRRMLEAGDRTCVMEVSSHALALHRAGAIHFELALFTNLTQDHLDFHRDMEEYFAAKRLLFEMGPKTSIVNVDDPYGRRLAEEFDCTTFSAEGAEADFKAHNVTFDATSASFTANIPPAAKLRCGPGCRGTSTSPMRWGRLLPLLRLGSRRRLRRTDWAGRGGFPGGSSRLMQGSPSRSWSITRTRRTRWRTCCERRGGSPRSA